MSHQSAAIKIDAVDHIDEIFAPRATSAPVDSRLRRAGDADQPAPSPPLDLQREVAAAVARGVFSDDVAAPAGGVKWSPRRTLAFLLVTCGGFWAAVAWAMLRFF